ncbi:MAG: NAD-dependent epimerase/dehydratase family protein [Planctomycetota bacterium]
MRILVTGATGFLGNNLVRALVRQNHDVTAVVRPSSDRKTLDGLDIELALADLNEPDDLGVVIREMDVVIHSAAMIQIGWTKLEQSRLVNVESTRALAEICRRQDARMVYVSSVDALASATEQQIGNEEKLDPPKLGCSYVISKRESETAFIVEVANGLDGVIVNPGFMVGPYDWRPSSGEMMLSVYKTPFLPFAPAGGCSVVDVRDVADGIVSAIEHGRKGQRYILGGENMSYFDLWNLMASVMQCSGPHRKLPDWIATSAGKCGDLVTWLSGKERTVNSAATAMGQMFHYYSSEKAVSELGYSIGSVENALRDAWDWFRLHPERFGIKSF